MKKNKFENILIITLWMLISILCICFWFNSQYGFNIFSGSHWQHLSYMQASQTPVKPSFYISLVISVAIMLIGLFLIIRPRLRKINFAAFKTHTTATNTNSTQQTPQNTSNQNNSNEPTLKRPPRLRVQQATVAPAPTPVANITPTVTPEATPAKTTMFPSVPETAPEITYELQNIFESAGYQTHTPTEINGVKPALLALGAHETLWIGATQISTDIMNAMIDVIKKVFSETLDDIEINIKPFIINATGTSPDTNIMTFTNIDDVRTYISEHPNPELTGEDKDTFDAFSSFINTVMQYLGTL